MAETQRSFLYVAGSEEDTARLARELSGFFIPGTVIGLDGDLGAGKTAFSKAVGQALGVKDMVNSPTFTIIKEYKGLKLPFYHMDVYRLRLEEAEEMGLDEYFYGEGVTLVEWASLIEELLPAERLNVAIEISGPTERTFHLIPHGAAYERWCRALKENGMIHEQQG